MRISTLSITKRLIAAFALLMVVNAFSILVANFALSKFVHEVQQSIKDRIEMDRLATEWATLTRLNGTRTVAILKSSDITLDATLQPDIQETSKRISEIQEKIKMIAQALEEKTILAEVS